jgi:single-strand DNA-binding protein
MINRTVLVGRITKEPDIKHTQNDIMFCRFVLAVNRSFTNAQGEKEVDFISCTAWRKQAENMGKFVDKGNLLGIDGRIETGSYDNKDGVRIYTTTVIADSVAFLEPKGQKEQERFSPPPMDDLPFEREGYKKR